MQSLRGSNAVNFGRTACPLAFFSLTHHNRWQYTSCNIPSGVALGPLLNLGRHQMAAKKTKAKKAPAKKAPAKKKAKKKATKKAAKKAPAKRAKKAAKRKARAKKA